MSRKASIIKYQIVDEGDMADDVTSEVTNIQFLDNVGIQANYTGSPDGELAVQVSADYARDAEGNVTNAGNWITLTSVETLSAPSPVYFDLNQLSAPWIRLKYTATASDGFLDAFITAKSV